MITINQENMYVTFIQSDLKVKTFRPQHVYVNTYISSYASVCVRVFV